MHTNKHKTLLSRFEKAIPSLIAIAIGLVIGVIIIFFTNQENAFTAITQFFKGPFNRGLTGFGDLLYHMTPLLMTGLSVGFAYQTGLFNIGASGQFMFGAFLAIVVGVKLQGIVPDSILWILALLAAGVVGALLASIVGILKAYRNVNEVITCIMLKYTSMYLVNDFIKRFGVYNQMKNNTVSFSTSIPKMGLDVIFPNTIAGGGIIIGIICVVILTIVLKKTTFGFELKGVGLNRNASRYAGITEKRSIIMSMVIAGLLAGMAGGMLYLSGAGNHMSVQEVLPQEGFDGIAIALLGLSDPIGIFFSAFLIAYLKLGGQAIQTLGFSPELITMIIAMILYISALSVLFQRLLARKRIGKIKEETEVQDASKEAEIEDETEEEAV